MKTLANCTPREFLKQTNRIRIAADEWLTATKILEIRQRMPEMPEPVKNADKAEVTKAIEERRLAVAEQAKKNLFAMLEAMLDINADKTLELLALSCFVEPEDVDKHTMSEYLLSISELLNDGGVVSFFDSLVRLGASNTASAVAQ